MVLPDHRPGERGGCRSRPLLASCVPDTTTVESEMAAEQSDVIIELDKVYKIFGPQPRGRALQLAKSGMKKNDVQAQTEHVVGMTNVSFQVSRGETFVIMGLSGSGKSTAIRTVNKLHDITDGRVIVDGVDVQALDGPPLQQFRREKMGMVFQHFGLFPHMTVAENVAFPLRVQGLEVKSRQAKAQEMITLVGLEGREDAYPCLLYTSDAADE